jgi:hypothetical protein
VSLPGTPLLHAVAGARKGVAESAFDMGLCFLDSHREPSDTKSQENLRVYC